MANPHAATMIQRVFRGHRVRRRVAQARREFEAICDANEGDLLVQWRFAAPCSPTVVKLSEEAPPLFADAAAVFAPTSECTDRQLELELAWARQVIAQRVAELRDAAGSRPAGGRDAGLS